MVDTREKLGLLACSPSFSCYSGNRLEQIAARVIRELGLDEEDDEFGSISHVLIAPPVENERTAANGGEGDSDGSDSDDFEFTFVCREPDAAPISADEIFADGQIRPLYPVFNRDVWFEDSADSGKGSTEAPRASVRVPLRKLFVDDGKAAAASDVDELERLGPGSYCVWTPRCVPPSPGRCKKSNSTGSSKHWRFKDLLHRSSSDGKDTFLFLSPSATGKERKPDALKGKMVNPVDPKRGKPAEAVGSKVSAHELHYVRNRALKESDRRRSFLPYRQDIVGFFANVNGLSRTLHPF